MSSCVRKDVRLLYHRRRSAANRAALCATLLESRGNEKAGWEPPPRRYYRHAGPRNSRLTYWLLATGLDVGSAAFSLGNAVTTFDPASTITRCSSVTVLSPTTSSTFTS